MANKPHHPTCLKYVRRRRSRREGDNPRQNLCPYCDKRFVRVEQKIAHMRVHQIQIKTTTCELCNKTFDGAAQRALHMRRHASKEVAKNVRVEVREKRAAELEKKAATEVDDASKIDEQEPQPSTSGLYGTARSHIGGFTYHYNQYMYDSDSD